MYAEATSSYRISGRTIIPYWYKLDKRNVHSVQYCMERCVAVVTVVNTTFDFRTEGKIIRKEQLIRL